MGLKYRGVDVQWSCRGHGLSLSRDWELSPNRDRRLVVRFARVPCCLWSVSVWLWLWTAMQTTLTLPAVSDVMFGPRRTSDDPLARWSIWRYFSCSWQPQN